MGVFLFIVAGAIVLSLVVRGIVGDQQSRLLHERGSQLALLLDESVSSIDILLPVAGAAEPLGTSSHSSFHLIASALVAGGSSDLVVFVPSGSTFRQVAKVGAGRSVPSVTPSEERLLRGAESTKSLVSAVLGSGNDRWLAIGTQIADHRVLLDESVLKPAKPTPVAASSPFSGVNLALYGSPSADHADLLAISGVMPTGQSDHEFLTVGADRWLIVVSASTSLVGSFASWSPWLTLLAGLLVALLVAALFEGVTRRRVYALGLVEERTRELRAAQELEQRAREEAELANRYKSDFISRMSHELRTPLNAVVGFAQLLELDDVTDEQRDSIDHILRGGQHLLTLINEILDIARIESGDFTLSAEPVLVSDAFAEVLGLIRPLAEQSSIHLVGVQATSCSEFVFADRHRLQQVLLNLLSNAVKYNRRGGSVAVSCEREGTVRLRIKVTDTGNGIPESQLERLFTPFERLGAERSDIEGTGIGLSLSRQLAEAMGGTLGVSSRLGEGSTFWIELPLVEAPVDRYERLNGHDDPPASSAVSPSRRAHSVLYIEDNLANVTLVQRIVAQRDGLSVISAMQGRLGLELAQDHLPILILLDLHLPDIGGEEVLEQLRRDPLTARIPVVVVSADATPGQIQRLLSAGALAYLTKPFDVNELLRLIDNCLATAGEDNERA
jgi:signal transduction histidine kinase/ActR/RegA family two-component response regulator